MFTAAALAVNPPVALTVPAALPSLDWGSPAEVAEYEAWLAEQDAEADACEIAARADEAADEAGYAFA